MNQRRPWDTLSVPANMSKSMKSTITPGHHFSFASLVYPDAPTTTIYITVDIHTENSLRHQATELLLADMLLSGCATMTRADILGAINETGGTLVISAGNGTVTITIKALTAAIPKLLTLLTKILVQPNFAPKELARAKKTTINLLLEAKEDSRSRAHHALINHYYHRSDRRYTYDIAETIKTVKEITKNDLQVLLTNILTTPWTVSIASNDTATRATMNWCKKLRHQSTTQTPGTHKQVVAKPITILLPIVSRQNIDFSIGAAVPINLHHPDYIPLLFGLAVLGKWGGFTGRLMSTVREAEGLTYGIYANLEQFSGTEHGMWRIMTFFAPGKAVQGLTSTFREITNIYQTGITEAELIQFKRILLTGHILQKDSVSAQLRTLHSYHTEGFTLADIEARQTRISTLTKDEVNHALQTYLNPSTISISGAGPTGTVQKAIQAFHKTMAY